MLVVTPDKVGALCSSDWRGIGKQYVEGGKLVVNYAMQGFGDYKKTESASATKMTDYKDSTDLVVGTAVDCRNATESSETNGTLQGKGSGNGYNFNSNNVCRQGSNVRRLTPLECERLQGFPDGWTLIGLPEEVEVTDYEYTYDEDTEQVIEKKPIGTHTEIQYFYIDDNGKKKKVSDSARYKALGNSIATPYWFHLMRRISAQYERPATLGSLFDGIGGFPLCWEKCNGEGTAIWASEIEEFPIAVTKQRFPEND